MTDAPQLAERSARTPPEPAEDFESFYLVNRVRLFRALIVVTRDVHAAEEVSQDAFVAVWERWDRVGRMDDPTGYLYRTALNRWFQVRRRAVRAARRVALPRPASDPLETIEERDALSRRLLELPARQRAALVLTDYLGDDSAEAGGRSASDPKRSGGSLRKAEPRFAASSRRTIQRERPSRNHRTDRAAF